MKPILKLCLFSIFLVAVAGCTKDEDNVTDGTIIGQWRMTDIHSNDGISETILQGQTITSSFTFHGTDYNTFTTFTENPNEFSSTGSYTQLTDLIVQGQTQHDTSIVDAFSGTGSWSISGNKMTQIFSGDTTTFDILELSDAKLRLQNIFDETVVIVSLNVIVHDHATVLTTFERQ